MDARSGSPGPGGFHLLVALLVVLGLVARFRAAFFGASEMFRSFPTEDGYLMLTVARNLSLGRGLTSAAGTLATNGVQPLATFADALVFWAVGSEREAGVRCLIVLYAAVSGVTAAVLYRLGRRLLGGSVDGRRASALGAAVWLASPVALLRTMNMLETGLYVLAVAAVALVFARWHAAPEPWPGGRCAAMGGLLGLAFWTRNDAVLLMGAFGLAHLGSSGRGASFSRRAREAALTLAVAAAASLPWVLYNYFFFGNIVPTSGRVHLEAGMSLASLSAAAVALFEMMMLAALFEFSPLQYRWSFVAFCGLAVSAAMLVCLVVLLRGRANKERFVAWLLPVLFGAALLGFYLFLFDAPHFVARYLTPLGPFLALLWGGAAIALATLLARHRMGWVSVVLSVLLLANFVVRDGLLVRGPWRRGALFRGVDWVAANARKDTWVGSFQSGTMGFFHDRTINLDGKLNPFALEAMREHRHSRYVVDSPIDLVIDWATLVEPWYGSDPILSQTFEWVELDRQDNFAVIARRGRAWLRPPEEEHP